MDRSCASGQFLTATGAALAGGVDTSRFPATRGLAARAPRILLRSSWQSVNIGDIGHTPGALRLLEVHFPEAEITLWPTEIGHGARRLLTNAFPRLRIAEGSLGSGGTPDTPDLIRAWEEADLYRSGSGSGFPAHQHAAAFHRATRKPVGVSAVSTDPISGFGDGREPEGGTLEDLRAKAMKLPRSHLRGDLRYILDHAAFVFCRDTISRDYLSAQGVNTPLLEFGPDAQLGMHLRDDEKGDAYRKAAGLEAGQFICVIPRLRYTPYYRIRNVPRTPADDIRDAINERTTETDHAKLREMIVSYVSQPTDTCKGQTYRGFGADAWLFEIDETSGSQLWSRLQAIHDDPAAARATVKTIMAGIEQRQRRMVEAVRAAAGGRLSGSSGTRGITAA